MSLFLLELRGMGIQCGRSESRILEGGNENEEVTVLVGERSDNLNNLQAQVAQILWTAPVTDIPRTIIKGIEFYGHTKKGFPKELQLAEQYLILKGFLIQKHKLTNETLRTLMWIHNGRLPGHRRHP